MYLDLDIGYYEVLQILDLETRSQDNKIFVKIDLLNPKIAFLLRITIDIFYQYSYFFITIPFFLDSIFFSKLTFLSKYTILSKFTISSKYG